MRALPEHLLPPTQHHTMLIGGPHDGLDVQWKDPTLPVQTMWDKQHIEAVPLITPDPQVVAEIATVKLVRYVKSHYFLIMPASIGAPKCEYTFYRWEGWQERLACRVLLLRVGLLDLYSAMRFE